MIAFAIAFVTTVLFETADAVCITLGYSSTGLVCCWIAIACAAITALIALLDDPAEGVVMLILPGICIFLLQFN